MRAPKGEEMAIRLRTFLAIALVIVLVAGSLALAGALRKHPGPQGDGTSITPTGLDVTPVGRQVKLDDRPYGMALSPNGRMALVSNSGMQETQSLMVVDTRSGNVRQRIGFPFPKALFIGVAFGPHGHFAYASGGGTDVVHRFRVSDGRLSARRPVRLDPDESTTLFAAGIAVSPSGKRLYVANTLDGSLSIVDLTRNRVIKTVPVGHNPYGVALSPNGRKAYVSNWGESSLSVLDARSGKPITTIPVGTHPSAVAVSPSRPELYVANTDSDSVSVIDTRMDAPSGLIDLAPYPGAPVGSNPNALAPSPDGRTLYVANAGNNDVAVVQLATPKRPADRVRGLIPTGWYPTGVAVAPNGDTIYVANGKGLGAGPNRNGPNPYHEESTPEEQYIGTMIEGTLSLIPTPSPRRLDVYTKRVKKNNHFSPAARRVEPPEDSVIPRHPGDESPIKHVIYVVKENRTYDQMYGSIAKGNGDASINLFRDRAAPNQRRLARKFVLLDNTYADAEVSSDGWSWSTGANANTYTQKTWPQNYSGRYYPYDYEGTNLASAPGRRPRNSYIWDRLDQAGVSYRNFGFWAKFPGQVPQEVEESEPNLARHTNHQFPGYNLELTDSSRFRAWRDEFRRYERRGSMPAVQLVRLPNDHTAGTLPGFPTPRAMVADNDWALGRLVDVVSHSRWWRSTAIFVVEDDAQDGPDHVDAHRMAALVVSPYTRGGKVDSTFYSTVSVLRTIELLAGIRPMTQFDALATPMHNAFGSRPVLHPYEAVKPEQPLDEMNGTSAPMAAASKRWNFSREDRTPERPLNRAIWKSVRGRNSVMPTPRYSLFQPGEPEAEEGESAGDE